MTQNPDWSYLRHEEQEQAVVSSDDVPSCYTNPDSVDSWRHKRMHDTVLPLIAEFPDATWLTIGDGRFGSDAHYLESRQVDVVASSLTDATLSIAKNRGFIKKFRAENAEDIDLSDNSFDFVLCKESYHHFPRPSIAFYEMIRVSKFGIILIEPIEQSGILFRVKNLVKKLIRGDSTMLFEPCGNFLFRVNLKELRKMLTAINYSWMAVKPFNDFYHPKLIQTEHPVQSMVGLMTKGGIWAQDILCKTRLLGYGLATVFVPKAIPQDQIQSRLTKSGYRIFELPKNPFI